MEQPSTLARQCLIAYLLLIAYGSLYPFTGWRDQGVVPLAFLFAPMPRYLTAFDLTINVLAYAPLGFLAVLAAHPALRGFGALLTAVLGGTFTSFFLEALQSYLPSRISSNLDLAANAAGAFIGALIGTACAGRLLRSGGMQELRYRLFLDGGRIDLGIVLLGLWGITQLNPETLLFGIGDLRDLFQGPTATLHPPDLFIRIEAAVACANTVAVGLFAASLTGRRQPVRRLIVLLLAAALAIRTLAFGVLFGAQDLLLWATPGAVYGIAAGFLVALAAVSLPRPARIALSGLALMSATVVVNLSPGNPYLSASLAVWKQGHFLNFNGLTRLVSVLWPFMAMGYLLLLAGARERPGR